MKDCKECEYHKEKYKETIENGKPLIYLEKIYCPLNECMFSDFPDMPHQFDNMTGSMNL